MRADLGRPKAVKAGDLVTIRLRLPKSKQHARLSVWSRFSGYPFAPHIQMEKLGVLKDGRPQMVSPMYAALHEDRREAILQFVADDNLDVMVRQEVDAPSEVSAKVRIIARGKTSQAVRRYCRDAFWQLRSYSEAFVRKIRRQDLVRVSDKRDV